MVAAIFLPGVLTPARVRYAPLLAELGGSTELVTKELEVYNGEQPRNDDYSLTTEVEALDIFATEHGYDRFHLYGYSIGASIALAYAAVHGNRICSLALEEPATDFSDADRQVIRDQEADDLASLPADQRMRVFLRNLVRPGVELGTSSALQPVEMANRAAGLAAIARPVQNHHIDMTQLRRFQQPVYFSYGSLSNSRWESMAARLEELFADCTIERYEGLHHLNTSHQVEPRRVAAALRQMWSRVD